MPTNIVTLQGRVHNFEERITKGGKRVSVFSVSFPNSGKETSFSYANVTAWELNENIVSKLSSGWSGTVLVLGCLKQESWETSNGKRSELKIIAKEVCLIAPKPKSEQAPVAAPVQRKTVVRPSPQPVQRPAAPQPQQRPRPEPVDVSDGPIYEPEQVDVLWDEDDDIPF